MARKRKPENAHLPANLTRDRGAWQYRDPITGKRSYVRGPEASAINEAHRRNALLGIGRPDSVAQVVARYPVRGSATTRSEKDRILAIYVERWGAFPIRSVTRRALADAWSTLGGPEAVRKHRSLWISVLRHALAWGLVDVNEAELTLPAEQTTRARLRHTDAGYAATYHAAPDWLQIAMELAVTTLQRRSDLIAVTRADVIGGVWRVQQDKTGVRLEITPGPRMEAALLRAIDTCPLHGTLVRTERGAVSGSYLSHRFARARDDSGAYADLPARARPSWHDLRAYGTWLYERAGHPVGYVQALAGHASAKMTEHYQEGHETRWQRVEAGL